METINGVNQNDINKINTVLLSAITKINTVEVGKIIPLPITTPFDLKMSSNGNFMITTGGTLVLHLYDKANKDLRQLSTASSFMFAAISDKYTSDTSIYSSTNPYLLLRGNSGGITSGFGQPAYRRHMVHYWNPDTEAVVDYEGAYIASEPTSASMSDDGKKFIYTAGMWTRAFLIDDGAPYTRNGSMGWWSSWTGVGEPLWAEQKAINDFFLSWSWGISTAYNRGLWWTANPLNASFDSNPGNSGWISIHTNQNYIHADVSPNGKYMAAIRGDGSTGNKLDLTNSDRIDFSNDFDGATKEISTDYFENPLFFRNVHVRNNGYAYLYNCATESHKNVLRRINLNDHTEAPVDVFQTPDGGRLSLFASNGTDTLFFEEGSFVYYGNNVIVY